MANTTSGNRGTLHGRVMGLLTAPQGEALPPSPAALPAEVGEGLLIRALASTDAACRWWDSATPSARGLIAQALQHDLSSMLVAVPLGSAASALLARESHVLDGVLRATSNMQPHQLRTALEDAVLACEAFPPSN